MELVAGKWKEAAGVCKGGNIRLSTPSASPQWSRDKRCSPSGVGHFQLIEKDKKKNTETFIGKNNRMTDICTLHLLSVEYVFSYWLFTLWISLTVIHISLNWCELGSPSALGSHCIFEPLARPLCCLSVCPSVCIVILVFLWSCFLFNLFLALFGYVLYFHLPVAEIGW